MATNSLVGRNIKVVAKGFNPPLFTEYWLKKENFVPENLEILPNAISTPQFVQISSKKFNLLVLPDQLQFNITDDSILGIEFIKTLAEKEKELKLIYRAMGFNFDYFVPDEDIKHGLFFVPANKLFQEFKVADAKYGTFISKNFENSRLSLSVKPSKALNPKGIESDVFHYSFNYHFDLTKGDSKSIIISNLNKWNKYYKYSQKLMTL
jgi:hypothetical protein